MNKTAYPYNPMVPKFFFYLPNAWFILGFLGFIGNILILSQSKFCSKTYNIYLFCHSLVDFLIVSSNVFLFNIVPLFHTGQSPFIFSFVIINVLLNFMILPHVSINFLLMAYIDIFASTCSRTSPLQRVKQLKATPWIFSLVVIMSFGYLALNYVPIPFLYNHESDTEGEQVTRVWAILYIFTNGLIQPILMLTIVLLFHQKTHKLRHRLTVISVSNSSDIRKETVNTMIAQILTTAMFSLAWTCLFLPGIINTDVEDLSKPMIYAVVISFFCYHLNNVKFFYISILTFSPSRKKFLKACYDLTHCCTHRRRSSTITRHVVTTEIVNHDDIPLRSM